MLKTVVVYYKGEERYVNIPCGDFEPIEQIKKRALDILRRIDNKKQAI